LYCSVQKGEDKYSQSHIIVLFRPERGTQVFPVPHYCTAPSTESVRGWPVQMGSTCQKYFDSFVRSYHQRLIFFFPFRRTEQVPKTPPLMRTSPCYRYPRPQATRFCHASPIGSVRYFYPLLITSVILPHHKSVQYS
jgi:hypothetical protein